MTRKMLFSGNNMWGRIHMEMFRVGDLVQN